MRRQLWVLFFLSLLFLSVMSVTADGDQTSISATGFADGDGTMSTDVIAVSAQAGAQEELIYSNFNSDPVRNQPDQYTVMNIKEGQERSMALVQRVRTYHWNNGNGSVPGTITVYEDGEKIIVQEGNTLSDIPLLSSGTKYGFNLANMVYAIKHHLNSIYLVDEQFAYISSDIEVALLGTMVELLGDDEQLFFTTHNSNILSMGFPFHSFYFLRKVKIGEKREIQVSCASELENRNNISPYNMYENDMFASAPDLSLIYSIK